jgi:membrane-associated phospholipid phosphatase
MFIILALIIVSSTISDSASRSYLTYDATIANQYNPNSTIPFWLAVVLPLICMILSLAVYEYIFYNTSMAFSKTSVVATALHFLIDFIFAAVVTALITEVSKLLVGRFRPDWLSRCIPATNSTEPSWGLSPADNPACTSGLPDSKLEDGHKSFPSGHSSNAFAMGVYISGYVIYCTYFRTATRYYNTRKNTAGGGGGGGAGQWKQQILGEMGTALSFVWILFNLSWAWGVGISRIIDNKHHPSDVIGGAFLGTVIGGAFVLRAVPRHFIVIPEEEIEEQQRQERYQQQPLLLDNAGRVAATSTSRLDA